jgi:hypothetical protein
MDRPGAAADAAHMWLRLLIPALLACLAAASGARAQALTEVDVELVLAVDVSRSMSPVELEIQRRGYAEALASDEVWGAVSGGLIGRIALTYVEWAGETAQTVVVPWTVIDSRASARAVAETLTASFSGAMRRTSISGALLLAADSFDRNDTTAWRRVIDISGDGPNNQGRPVLEARDDVLARGIVINGLPLMTRDALSARWGIDDLDIYYANCVIGGPGAFVQPVLDWSQFADAVRRKLVLEIAAPGHTAPPGHAAAPRLHRAAGYDCEIGEKIWRRNQGDWNIP